MTESYEEPSKGADLISFNSPTLVKKLNFEDSNLISLSNYQETLRKYELNSKDFIKEDNH